MSLVDLPVQMSELSKTICDKLQNGPGPLKLADIAKGLKPKKMKLPDFLTEVHNLLEEQVRLGSVFRNASGKDGTDRYWDKDEKHLLRLKAVEFAATPKTLAKMTTNLGKEVKGVDKGFVEALVRELIGDDQLYEYPPAKKNAGPQFGAFPPPPPLPTLEQPKYKKTVKKLIADALKLLAAAGVSPEELLRILREGLNPTVSEKVMEPQMPTGETKSCEEALVVGPSPSSFTELENLILKEVANTPVVSLTDLRANLPSEFQGKVFDKAILHLATEQKIVVFQDADPSSFSQAERAGYVLDGDHVYTTIAKRN